MENQIEERTEKNVHCGKCMKKIHRIEDGESYFQRCDECKKKYGDN